MRIESVGKGSVCLHLGSESAPFRILVGSENAGPLDQYHLWVLSERVEANDDFSDEVCFAGLRLACTYPVWLSLPSALRRVSKQFKSFNQPWPLPCGWTVYPVSSGGASTNWLFKTSSTNVLVTGESSSVATQCLYRPIFKPSATAPVERVDVLVPLASAAHPVTSMSELKEAVNHESDVVKISMNDPIEALAVTVQLTHAIAKLPAESQGPVVVSSDWWDSLNALPALFEWLHEDIQTYLNRCVLHVAERNKEIQPLALADLVESGRVVFTDSLPENAKVFIQKGPGGLFRSSTPAELKQFYSPSLVLATGQHTVRDGAQVGLRMPGLDELRMRVQTRWPDASITETAINVPSVGASVEMDANVIREIRFANPEEAAKLLHLLA